MMSWEIIQINLLSPIVLSFFLGLFAVLIKSDLKLPHGLYACLSMYLLLALGLKGGATLSETPLHLFWGPGLVVLALGMTLPLIVYSVARFIGKMTNIDASALAAHYGSVSVVTFIACHVFVESMGHPADGFMTALVVVLEVPGIVVALLIAELFERKNRTASAKTHTSFFDCFKGLIVSQSILLLLGGLAIGYISGKPGLQKIAPVFVDPFHGALVLFMLDMGLVAGERLSDLRGMRGFLLTFSFLAPIFNGSLGVLCGYWAGLSLGGATVLGAMAGSASYIAAPAAVRIALPEANPAYYLTSAIALTFPFNLAIGIPLYYEIAYWLFGK
jgi:hypothetical protein